MAAEPREAADWIEGQVLPGRCPRCTGAVVCLDGDARCLWCARTLLPDRVQGGVILSWTPLNPEPKLSNVGHLEERRVRRQLAAEESQNGVIARVLLALPDEQAPPDLDPPGISRLAKLLAMSNQAIRETIEILLEYGYAEQVEYRGGRGHRYTGYRRSMAYAR